MYRTGPISMFIYIRRSTLIIGLILLLCPFALARDEGPGNTSVESGIRQAISDEFIALRYYKALASLPWSTTVYIAPLRERTYRVIYDFPPFGEVMREAYVQRDGTVLLALAYSLPCYTPLWGAKIGNMTFAPTHSYAIKTRYFDARKLARMKAESRRVVVTIRRPTEEELRAASVREDIRLTLGMGGHGPASVEARSGECPGLRLLPPKGN